MKLLPLAGVLGMSLVLSGCVTPYLVNDDQLFNSYLEGHMQMLSKEAPWMSEAQRLQHGRAQAAEIVRNARAGGKAPLVVIPIPEAPSAGSHEASAAAPASRPKAASAAAAPGVAVRPPESRAASVAKALAPASAIARPPASSTTQTVSLNGTYVLQAGSYSMQIEQVGNDLAVIEPNRRSLYTRQGDGSYQFHNPNTGSTFSLRFIDANTVEADRVPTSGSPSLLKRASTAVQTQAARTNTADMAIAERYQQLALSDPVNAQAWAFCAGVAFKRSQSAEADFARYASQAAASLKLLGAASNPCSDAIPNRYW